MQDLRASSHEWIAVTLKGESKHSALANFAAFLGTTGNESSDDGGGSDATAEEEEGGIASNEKSKSIMILAFQMLASKALPCTHNLKTHEDRHRP